MEQMVSVCGTYCGFCPAFRKYQCLGCYGVNERAKLSCAMYRCAREKGIRSCFLCDDFPCKIHFEKGLIYKHSFLQGLKTSDFSIARKAVGKPN